MASLITKNQCLVGILICMSQLKNIIIIVTHMTFDIEEYKQKPDQLTLSVLFQILG